MTITIRPLSPPRSRRPSTSSGAYTHPASSTSLRFAFESVHSKDRAAAAFPAGRSALTVQHAGLPLAAGAREGWADLTVGESVVDGGVSCHTSRGRDNPQHSMHTEADARASPDNACPRAMRDNQRLHAGLPGGVHPHNIMQCCVGGGTCKHQAVVSGARDVTTSYNILQETAVHGAGLPKHRTSSITQSKTGSQTSHFNQLNHPSYIVLSLVLIYHSLMPMKSIYFNGLTVRVHPVLLPSQAS